MKRIIFVVLIVAIAFINTISIANTSEKNDINFLVTQITINTTKQAEPSIYADYIVWTDWRNDPPDGTNLREENSDGYGAASGEVVSIDEGGVNGQWGSGP